MKRPNDFVLDLLNEKKLPLREKEKLLQLVVKEIKLGSQMDSKIWEEINKLKNLQRENSKKPILRDLDPQKRIKDLNLINDALEENSIEFEPKTKLIERLNNTPIKDLPDGEYVFQKADGEKVKVRKINGKFTKEDLEYAIGFNFKINFNHHSSIVVINEFAEIAGASQESIIDYTPLVDDKNTNNLPIFHYPQEFVLLLSNFSKHGHPFKDATHGWEYDPTEDNYAIYRSFLSRLDEYKSLLFQMQNRLNGRAFPKIMNFLFTENKNGFYINKNEEKKQYAWGDHKIKYGWRTEEIIKVLEGNPCIDPFEIELPNSLNIEGKQISKFGQVIDVFKSEIEIRKEINQLYEILKGFKLKLGRDFGRTFELTNSLNGVQFYTDVALLKSALKIIFEAIGKRPMYPSGYVTINSDEKINSYSLEICQKDSLNSETYSDEMLKEIDSGDFASIKNALIHLCDWSIESTFKDGSFRLNYLASSTKIPAKEHKESAEGFKHILTFYR
jgi:hypothetical protein